MRGDTRGYAGICGALPRTPVKTLLGKGLDNPQNLSRGSKIGIFSANGRLRKRKSLCGESVLDFVCVIDKIRVTYFFKSPVGEDGFSRKTNTPLLFGTAYIFSCDANTVIAEPQRRQPVCEGRKLCGCRGQ